VITALHEQIGELVLGRLARALIAVTLVIVAAPAAAAPAMWEVRDEDSSIWLFGSIRNLPVDLQWRTQLFDEVLADANMVVFEADSSEQGNADSLAAAFAHGVYTDGTLLTDILDPDTELTLRQAADMAGVPHGMLVSMRPWFAASIIYIGSEVAQGFGDYSLAGQLQEQLPADRLLFLATAEELFRVIDDVTEHQQLVMLLSTLKQLETIPKAVNKLRSNWLAGTPENVAEAFLMDGAGFSNALIEIILRPRAQSWLPKMTTMLRDNEENLIIVETPNLVGHLSLLDMLTEAGYAIERVQ
jgi:uncharacterized protein YbaP (TraB family)